MKHFYLKFTKKTFIHLFLGICLLLVTQGMQAATITSKAVTANWSTNTTWVGDVAPTAADNVIIVSGATITINVNLTMDAGTTITVDSGGILKTTSTANTSIFDTLAVNGLYDNNGTLTVRVSLEGAGNFNNSINNLSTLILSGPTTTVATLTTGSNGNTVNYNGGNQTIKNITTYRKLVTSGTGTKTWTITVGSTAQGLTLNSGAPLNISGNFTFTLGTTGSTISDALTFDASYTGNRNIFIATIESAGSIIDLHPTGGTFTVATGNSIINNGTIRVNSININNTSTLTNNGTITCNTSFGSGTGTFTNNAAGILNYNGATMVTTFTFNASTAGNTVNYGRAGIQTIRPLTYSNLTLSGSGTKTVAAATAITIASGGVATVNEGIILNNLGTITNSGDLILRSSATGTASLTSTSSLNNVTQQRYLSSNQRGWRLLSNPLASTTFNTLATASGITIGTNFTGEYVSSSNTWTSTDGTANMDTQKAYKVFITGLAGQSPAYVTGPSNVTLVNKGTAANTAPAGIATTATQYYLVANPYTAPVSLSSIIAASSGLSNTVAYYDPTNASSDAKVKAGGYDTTTATGAAGSASDVVIPAMGAIFVYATSGGTINIPTSVIFTGTPAQSGTYNHKTASAKVASNNALQLEVKSGSVFYDKVVFQFKAAGDATSNIDFGKLSNDILNVYSIAGTQKMAVSELELAAQTIPLGITSTSLKNYTFSVAENTIPAGYEAVLVDSFLNTETVLAPGASYDFAIDSNAASKGDARFAINLKTTGTLSVVKNELDSKIDLWPNPARGQFNILNTLDQKEGISTIEISNINGQMIHSQKSNPGTTTTVQTNNWAAGVYILKATNNGAQTTKKLIIQ